MKHVLFVPRELSSACVELQKLFWVQRLRVIVPHAKKRFSISRTDKNKRNAAPPRVNPLIGGYGVDKNFVLVFVVVKKSVQFFVSFYDVHPSIEADRRESLRFPADLFVRQYGDLCLRLLFQSGILHC